jgi:hypothetical protein
VTPRVGAASLIATVLVVAALHWLQVLAAPIVFALFLMALMWPVQARLEARKPRGLALMISVQLLLAAAAALLLAIAYGISVIMEGLAPYAPRMQAAYVGLGQWLEVTWCRTRACRCRTAQSRLDLRHTSGGGGEDQCRGGLPRADDDLLDPGASGGLRRAAAAAVGVRR